MGRKSKHRNIPVQQWLADKAVKVARQQKEEVDELEERVETTVKDQKRLLRENNFAARLERAYK